ncbi:restriction endonuclease subunit S [Segatella copri]|uniref:restriction endonuclease subunit S n=1 Tax=Segatella copri TaxID=165179 RepID=UPI001931B328|nr:restriction endonuclease subunit S [Segatella copri]MBM0128992.1 restriction endonuclease subunit S [Segatella copri]
MEWKEVRLGDVCEIITGFPFPGKKYSKEGIRVVRGDNVTIGNLRWDAEKDKRWNEPFDKTEYYSLQANDIVIGMDGSRVGKNKARIKKEDLPLLLAQRVACVRHNELAEQDYLYYNIFSKKFIDYVNSIHTGSAIPHISQKQIEDYKILLPDLETQRRIASILSSLDRKIELNNKINADLEEMAQAIFKNWFVDFEPFKDGKFVDSELGMIPEGWKVGRADDFYQINIGKTPPRKEHIWFSTNPADKIWVSIANMGNSGIFISDSSEYLTKEAVDRHNIIMVPRNTILLSFKLTVGRVAIADKELTTNEAIARFILSDDKYMEYLYLYLKKYDYNSLGSTSSIATAVNSKTIKGMQMLQPSDKIIDAFHIQVNPIFEKIRSLTKENSRLSLLRDTLLPRLMSGELEVPE